MFLFGQKARIKSVKLYKVVDSKLSSVFVSAPGRIKYKIGKISKPRKNCGPLACFRSLGHALTFKAPWHIILEGDGEISESRFLWISIKGKEIIWLGDIPPGTVLVDFFKPRKLVG